MEVQKYKVIFGGGGGYTMVVIGKYLVVSVVGRGRYGWVSRAKNLELGLDVALKHAPWAVGEQCKGGTDHTECDHVKDSMWQAALTHEASVLSQISHPAIVSLLDVGKGPSGTMYICLEDLGNTSLETLVQEQGEPGLSESISFIILRQVASGLRHLHKICILHRDVKPDNIMVVRKARSICVKIIDLGLAATWAPGKLLNTSEFRAGTLIYMAPELMKANTNYGSKVDVFSLGASLYFTLFGESPFQEFIQNHIRMTTAIFGLQIQHEEMLNTISTENSTILKAMLCQEPSQRISLSTLKANYQINIKTIP